MVNFTNKGVLGTQEEFNKNMLGPILRGREPDATPRQKQRMMEVQNEMSLTVNDFILRRINTVNGKGKFHYLHIIIPHAKTSSNAGTSCFYIFLPCLHCFRIVPLIQLMMLLLDSSGAFTT